MMLEKVEATEGFFRKYHRDVESSLTESELKEFADLKTNEERFCFVLKLTNKYDIPIQQIESEKDYDAAIKLKTSGNKAFQEQNYKEAWLAYSECALKIPWQSGSNPELAIIFANRSAALYHMQEYDLALQDIELSFTHSYPLELQYKITDRKARCFLAQKQMKDALTAFRETLTALDSAKLSIEKKKKWQMDVQIMLSMLGQNKNLANAPLHSVVSKLPSLTGGCGSYKMASAAVRIDQTPSMGRYAVAAQNIQVGDTLIVEPAFCSVLLGEYAKTHCFHCLQRLKNPLPCSHCSIVAFCCLTCQQNALKSHHKIECSVLKSLWSSGASVTCLMALRIFSQSNIEHFLSLRPRFGQPQQIHQRGDYVNVYNLVTHEAKRATDDLFHRASMAVFLFKCLQKSSYFGEHTSKAGEEPTPNESFVGGLLLHHLQFLQFNAHEISELVVDEGGGIEAGQSIFLGGGLYPTLALFNHSCDPGVIRYFLGTSVVVRAAKNIQIGEMIGENYGPIFTQTAKTERQISLKNQYWFNCTCNACEEDWPLFEDMDSNILRFKCSGDNTIKCTNAIEVSTNTMEFIIQCSACKQYTNILKGLKALQDTDALFKKAKHFMKKKDALNALTTFCELLIRLDETLAPPFRDYHLCQQGIRRCMLFLGNHYQKR